ncbi:EI24 domain-containing protein [Gelidibacter maritimus]|uniref:EI24 domain-containing protein n=1 Tax=Gelidibacter maritimus TaxID=2761487 RepID=A0A7W2M349_9FLAO|nr:EI24 domain-containing protein [Gelidibacter maritimus]MBA6151839.1 EI24 domain-containing protein [Gelidibacter maritimus]
MIGSILKGIKAYTGTFKLISKLKLWKFFGIPMLISFLVASAIIVSAYSFSDNFAFYISKLWVWEWGSETFFVVSEILSGILILVLGFILYKHIVMALSAPFMSPVSEKIEAYLLGVERHQHRDTSFSEQLWRGIKINIRNLMMELLLTIPIILIGFVPIIGIFSSIVLFLVQAYYAGFGNMDYTLERHFKYAESIKFVKQHRGLAIGNGIVFMLFLLIPVIGIIFVLPLSVTAASTETVALLKSQNRLKSNDL